MIEVVAEIGVNHDGQLTRAEALIRVAKAARADAVKFQLWNSKRVYRGRERERMRVLELSHQQLRYLKRYCDLQDLEFLVTPDEYEDAVFLVGIGVKRLKIGSQNVRNLAMLHKVAELGLPIILSTGAATAEEVTSAVQALASCKVLTLLHCVSAYPAPLGQMNMSALLWLASFGHGVGLSDHTTSNIAAVVALGGGATLFEKHITYDRLAIGPDHAASLDQADFVDYVRTLRLADTCMGDGKKRIMDCEQDTRDKNTRVLKHYAPDAVAEASETGNDAYGVEA